MPVVFCISFVTKILPVSLELNLNANFDIDIPNLFTDWFTQGSWDELI